MPLDPNIAIGPLGPTPWAGVMAGINAGQEAATQRQQIALQKAQQAIENQRAQTQAKYYEQIAANEQDAIKQRAETAAASLAEKKAEAEQRQETARLNRESRERIAARRDAGNNKLTAQEWKNYSQSLRDAVFLGYQPGSPEAEQYAMGMLEDFRRQFAGGEAQPSASVDAIAASPPPNVLLPSVAPQAAPFGQGPRVGGLIPASPLTPKAPVPVFGGGAQQPQAPVPVFGGGAQQPQAPAQAPLPAPPRIAAQIAHTQAATASINAETARREQETAYHKITDPFLESVEKSTSIVKQDEVKNLPVKDAIMRAQLNLDVAHTAEVKARTASINKKAAEATNPLGLEERFHNVVQSGSKKALDDFLAGIKPAQIERTGRELRTNYNHAKSEIEKLTNQVGTTGMLLKRAEGARDAARQTGVNFIMENGQYTEQAANDIFTAMVEGRERPEDMRKWLSMPTTSQKNAIGPAIAEYKKYGPMLPDLQSKLAEQAKMLEGAQQDFTRLEGAYKQFENDRELAGHVVNTTPKGRPTTVKPKPKKKSGKHLVYDSATGRVTEAP